MNKEEMKSKNQQKVEEQKSKKSKCLEIAYLVRVEKANLNASGTEGNITLLKKVRDIDGNEYVYISGVAVKYWIKEMLKELGEELKVKCSPILSKGEDNPESKEKIKEDQITSTGNPINYIDDDLFGYFLPRAGRKRIAPVKTNGLISLFPYTGDINLGVRYDPKGKDHSLWNLEIVNTIFRGNWLIELDRIYEFNEEELNNLKEDVKEDYKKKSEPQKKEEKEKRIKALLTCFFNLFGGAKQSSFLTSTEPRVVCLVFLKRKKLAIFDRLRVNSNFELEKEPLLEGLKLHADDINEVYIGIDTKLIKTDLKKLENEIKSVLKGEEKEKLKEQKNSQNNTRISNNKDNSKNEEEEKVVVVKDLYEIKKMILSDSFKFYKEGKSQTN